MAERGKGLTFEALMKELKERKFAPVYLLAGEEPYYIDKIADYITNNVLPEDQRDFNQMVVYGLDSSAVQIMDAAHAAPMMAEYQVIIVREAQNLKNIELLEKYIQKPVPSTILVVCYKKEIPKSKKGWVGECQKNGVVFESKKVYDSALPGFITSYLKTRKADIEPKAVTMLADNIGTDLSRLASELDKLLITLPENDRRVTPEFVEEKIGISKDFNPFELRDAIVHRDIVKANRIVKYFDKNNKAGNVHSVIPGLFSFFQNVMLAYYCPQRNNENEMAAWLGLRSGWFARDYVTAVRTFSGVKTMQIITKLRTTLAKSNGLDNRSATDGQLLSELIYFILH